MIIITDEQIKKLNINPSLCIDWVKESFMLKDNSVLPPKISLHPQGDDFFNTMPVLIPGKDGAFLYGVKVVHRLKNTTPSLGSDILLYNALSGELLALINGDWITAMRTGAVAALSALMFRKSEKAVYSFSGLGNTARSTLLCLLEKEPDFTHNVLLLKYKDQATSFKERFNKYPNVNFMVYDDIHDLLSHTDVHFHCVTSSPNLFCADNSVFHEGFLLIPIHTRGFQNCDLFFDKIIGDDKGHINHFQYFNQFKYFAEMTDVLKGRKQGRENDKERIICYNIGIALHDITFAIKVYEKLSQKLPEVCLSHQKQKFWV